jgi:prevent-host-death family protein
MTISIAIITEAIVAEYSVADAKNHLPKLIDKALEGEEVVITRRGKPVVELRPAVPQPKPPIGSDDWLFERTRARPGAGLTSVQILDLLNEADQDEHLFGRQLSGSDPRRGTGKRRG